MTVDSLKEEVIRLEDRLHKMEGSVSEAKGGVTTIKWIFGPLIVIAVLGIIHVEVTLTANAKDNEHLKESVNEIKGGMREHPAFYRGGWTTNEGNVEKINRESVTIATSFENGEKIEHTLPLAVNVLHCSS